MTEAVRTRLSGQCMYIARFLSMQGIVIVPWFEPGLVAIVILCRLKLPAHATHSDVQNLTIYRTSAVDKDEMYVSYTVIVLAAWLIAYFLILTFRYVINVTVIRKTRVPYISVPWLDQNHPVWMVLSPIIRPWLKGNMPTWAFDRIALCIYGQELHQGEEKVRKFLQPQISSNPELIGSGKTYFLATSGRLELWTWDNELATEILARHNDFRQFDMYGLLLGIFGHNVMTLNDRPWADHRRIVAGAVNEQVSHIVWDEAIRQTKALLDSMTEKCENTVEAEKPATTNRMFDMMKRITIHVLFAAGMGKRVDFGGNNEGLDKPRHGLQLSYIDAVKVVNANATGLTLLPTSLLLNWPTWLPGYGTMSKLGHAKIEFPQHTHEALAEERKMTGRRNVLSSFVQALNQSGDIDAIDKPSLPASQSGRKIAAMSDEEIVGNMYIFTVAGFDSTSNALAYALVLLARYPSWQQWIFEELDSILPTDSAVEIDYTTIFPKAIRTLAILYETLRLFPVLMHEGKETKTTQTIQTSTWGDVTIPAGTTVYVNNFGLHRDPAVWRGLNGDEDFTEDGTPDELMFRPSRWISTTDATVEQFHQPTKGTYLAWSMGPRICPGQKMAKVEFVAILITLFRSRRMQIVRRHSASEGEESDQELNDRLDSMIGSSFPKMTLEMAGTYDLEEDETGQTGLRMRWLPRSREPTRR